MVDFSLIAIMGLAFAAVAAAVFAAAQSYLSRDQMRRRLSAPASAPIASNANAAKAASFRWLIAEHFVEGQFGVDTALRTKLRRELVKAGYFNDDAIRYYIFARLCTVLALPVSVFLVLQLIAPAAPIHLLLIVVGACALLGIFLPDAYLSRRQRILSGQYRLLFPDLLDLLVVCVTAGLSIEAAFDRVGSEIAKQHETLGMNIGLMGAETRAGRSMMEALTSFAGRLGLDEASALVAVMRQSIELGGDIGDLLRIYSDEMREKRLLRAEETANKLSVKIVMPLGAFIFPVILAIVLLPILIKLSTLLK